MILIVLDTIFILILVVFLVRNNAVYKRRIALIDEASRLAKESIDAGMGWSDHAWYYHKIHTSDYWAMLFEFWKPWPELDHA